MTAYTIDYLVIQLYYYVYSVAILTTIFIV